MTERTFVVVGSVTRDTPYFQGARGKGITVFAFDEKNGELIRLSEKGGVDNPTYLTVHEGNRCVYANSEVFGWNEGTISAYRLDPRSGGLSYINKQPALGSILAHNSLDRSGRFVFVANYSVYAEPDDTLPDQSVVVIPIRSDGGLGPAVCSRSHPGSGPNAARQERSHAHCVLASPDNRHILVADLGIDELVVYGFDAASGVLSAETSFSMKGGAGPGTSSSTPPLATSTRSTSSIRRLRLSRSTRRQGDSRSCRRFPRFRQDMLRRAIAAVCSLRPMDATSTVRTAGMTAS